MTVLITTSHRPTSRIRSLSHDIQRVLPGSYCINRGKLNIGGVVEQALALGADRFMILERWKGAPGKIELSLVKPTLQCFFPVIYLSSVQLQSELRGPAIIRGSLMAVMPEVVVPELRLFAEALAEFFQVPLLSSRDVKESSSASIVFDLEGSRVGITFRNPVRTEIGPRLVCKDLKWSDRRQP